MAATSPERIVLQWQHILAIARCQTKNAMCHMKQDLHMNVWKKVGYWKWKTTYYWIEYQMIQHDFCQHRVRAKAPQRCQSHEILVHLNNFVVRSSSDQEGYGDVSHARNSKYAYRCVRTHSANSISDGGQISRWRTVASTGQAPLPRIYDFDVFRGRNTTFSCLRTIITMPGTRWAMVDWNCRP